MDTNVYFLEMLAAERLAELRAARARAGLLSPTPRRNASPLRELLGLALIRAGRWLARRSAARRRARLARA
ncbi:MAG TPA: hypothetical protein VGT40_08185 [Methylomirabilota bacterium]|jgi:hypothetical protein|nr:hypothetical protein [Methylomirabilota bacterium]